MIKTIKGVGYLFGGISILKWGLNIKIKLKWKLTLFTVLIMTITSGIVLFSINYDVRHTVPQLKGIINSNTEDIKIDLNGDFKDEIDKIYQ